MLLWPPILGHNLCHYNDVIMSAMAFQITGVSIACSTICSGVDTRASNAGNISISWRHHVFCHIVRRYLHGGRMPYLIFEVKLTFEMLTVRGQQHSFSTHERVFLRKCQNFETENASTWGGLEPPTFGFMPNALTCWAIRARHLPWLPYSYLVLRSVFHKIRNRWWWNLPGLFY